MDSDLRTALLAGGLFFCALFTGLTIFAMFDFGFDIFILTSFLIVAMITVGLVGAIRNPPPDD